VSPRADKEFGPSAYCISSQLANADEDKRLDRVTIAAKTIDDHKVQVRKIKVPAPQLSSRSSSSVERRSLDERASTGKNTGPTTITPNKHTSPHTQNDRPGCSSPMMLGCDHGLSGQQTGTASQKQTGRLHLRVQYYHYTPQWSSFTCSETWVLVSRTSKQRDNDRRRPPYEKKSW
jgi:hypothetical protein